MKIKNLFTLLIISMFSFTLYAQPQTDLNTSKTQNDNAEISKIKADIAELLKVKKEVSIWQTTTGPKGWKSKGQTKNISLKDDRIEFNITEETAILYFADIIDSDFSTSVEISTNNEITIIGDFMIVFREKVGIGQKICADFKQLQKLLQKQRTSQLSLLEPIAAKYRSTKIKPLVSEEQRKYIVQANYYNQQKSFEKAIETYKKAIETDQIAYPAAYSNLALISAQLKKYNAAIYNMKKYLMLEPEASDARSCQDKIYEWETELEK